MIETAEFLAMERVMAGEHGAASSPSEATTYRSCPAYSVLITLEPGETVIGKVIGEKLLGGVPIEYRILVNEIDRDTIGYVDAAKVRPLADNVVVLGRRR